MRPSVTRQDFYFQLLLCRYCLYLDGIVGVPDGSRVRFLPSNRWCYSSHGPEESDVKWCLPRMHWTSELSYKSYRNCFVLSHGPSISTECRRSYRSRNCSMICTVPETALSQNTQTYSQRILKPLRYWFATHLGDIYCIRFGRSKHTLLVFCLEA